MILDEIPIGLEGIYSVLIEEEHVPFHLRGSKTEVVSTPDLVRFMERTAFESLIPFLPDKMTSVGTKVSLNHLSGTPKGMKITVKTKLIERDRRRCLFTAEIFDEYEKVAEGTNERFLIITNRSNVKLMKKKEMIS
tara:strand:+ start:2315 stop:2722 length:408 start_codon:yes stop_codon:yes gene_type:complete